LEALGGELTKLWQIGLAKGGRRDGNRFKVVVGIPWHWRLGRGPKFKTWVRIFRQNFFFPRENPIAEEEDDLGYLLNL